jgi:hypothetical protein
MVKYYIVGIFSIIALLFYSFPWTLGTSRASLGFYIISFFWFMFAWMFLVIQLFFGIYDKIKNNKNWKHHLIASSLIIISYIVFFIMLSKGYSVTV